MSTIASFYLLDIENIPSLKERALTPVGMLQRKMLGINIGVGKWQDSFHEFLVANSQELNHFHGSGSVIFTEVFDFLESQSIDIETFIDKDLSSLLSTARNGGYWAFQNESARSLGKAIESVQVSTEMIKTFLEQSETETLTTDENTTIDVATKIVTEGVDAFKNWILQVREGMIGLLHIG